MITHDSFASGGFLKGTDHLANEFIGEVYANSVVAQLGGRVMTGLQGDIAIPKLSASVTNTAFVAYLQWKPGACC